MATPTTATSEFIQADDEDDFDESDIPGFSHPALDKGKSRAQDQLAEPSSVAPLGRSGNIGSSSNTAPPNGWRMVGGVRVESRFGGVDTLDEPILKTISRDLLSIYSKLVQVLYPPSQGRDVLRDWDLWGPLVLCLTLGILLSYNAPPSESMRVFTGVVVIVSLGSLVVTVQTKLLGGKISFFQGLCVLGYCIAPLNIAAFIACFVRQIWIRAPIALAAWAWCIWASKAFLNGSNIEQQRILLAVYPLLLFYFILAWMILIQ